MAKRLPAIGEVFQLEVDNVIDPLSGWSQPGWSFLGPTFEGRHTYTACLLEFPGRIKDVDEALTQAQKIITNQNFRFMEGHNALRAFIAKYANHEERPIVFAGNSYGKGPNLYPYCMCLYIWDQGVWHPNVIDTEPYDGFSNNWLWPVVL